MINQKYVSGILEPKYIHIYFDIFCTLEQKHIYI